MVTLLKGLSFLLELLSEILIFGNYRLGSARKGSCNWQFMFIRMVLLKVKILVSVLQISVDRDLQGTVGFFKRYWFEPLSSFSIVNFISGSTEINNDIIFAVDLQQECHQLKFCLRFPLFYLIARCLNTTRHLGVQIQV